MVWIQAGPLGKGISMMQLVQAYPRRAVIPNAQEIGVFE